MQINEEKLRGLDSLFDDWSADDDVVNVGIAVLKLPIFEDGEDVVAICSVVYGDDGGIDVLEPIGYFFDEEGAALFSHYIKHAVNGECKPSVVTADEVPTLEEAVSAMRRMMRGGREDVG